DGCRRRPSSLRAERRRPRCRRRRSGRSAGLCQAPSRARVSGGAPEAVQEDGGREGALTPAESHAEVASPPAAVNAAAPSPIPPPPANTALGLRSDRWAWVCLLVAVPSLLASLGGPLGEPVADDYDFLHHAAFAGRGRWLDGGGSLFYWRPLARQLYYR